MMGVTEDWTGRGDPLVWSIEACEGEGSGIVAPDVCEPAGEGDFTNHRPPAARVGTACAGAAGVTTLRF